MKKLFIILILFFIIAASLAVYFNRNASRHQEDLTQERYLRMVAEANLEKANGEISSLEGEIAKLKNKNVSVEKLLQQTSTTNTDLKVKLEKTSQINEVLESKLKELEKSNSAENVSSSIPPDISADKI